MKLTLLLVILVSTACAQRRVDATPAAAPATPGGASQAANSGSLSAIEIEYLKAQLTLVNQQLEISTLPQVMKARLAVIEAAERLKAAQEKAAELPPQAKPKSKD